MARFRYHHYAWGLLGYILIVILGGGYVRASISGDGCGQHWPDCYGHFIPLQGEVKTRIEFAHRASTALLGLMVIAAVVGAWRTFPRGHLARSGAATVLGFTILEALIGRWLVMFKLVAHDRSVYRAVAMPLHLVATLGLLAAATVMIWGALNGSRPRLSGQGRLLVVIASALAATMVLAGSGAVTALGDTLFPAASLAEGLKQDLERSAHFLVTLRAVHPVLAIAVGLGLALAVIAIQRLRPSEKVDAGVQVTLVIYLVQVGLGLANLALAAPIWMQLVHLLVADIFWISLVLLTCTALSEPIPSRVEVGVEAHPRSSTSARQRIGAYVALTKPRVISLLLFTTLAAMFIAAGAERAPAPNFWLCVTVGVGFYMAAGAANAVNMVLERDLDLAMGRTASRPTVTRAIPPRNALVFALVLAVGSFMLLWGVANLLCASLALAGLAFYVLVYTLLLKRRTWTNIVIGGAAGAFPPLVGWAAMTGNLSPLAWCLFTIIFLWTPVHFWALAILLKDDYARAGVPMLPVVRGERATVTQISVYAVLTALLTVLPFFLPAKDGGAVVGNLYLVAVVLLNGALLAQSLRLYRAPDRTHARALFKYSMVYLALLFLAMALDQPRGI
jgi:protoheme IX farnesyltransferase